MPQLMSNAALFTLANTLILFSNMQVNVFVFRINLILASLCYGLWGYFYIQSYDTFAYNMLFILINVALIISDLKKMFQKIHGKDKNSIYQKHYKALLSNHLYDNFMKCATKKRITHNQNIINIGEPYKLICIASESDEPQDFKVFFKNSFNKKFPVNSDLIYFCYTYFFRNHFLHDNIKNSEIEVSIELNGNNKYVDYWEFDQEKLSKLIANNYSMGITLYQHWMADLSYLIVKFNDDNEQFLDTIKPL